MADDAPQTSDPLHEAIMSSSSTLSLAKKHKPAVVLLDAAIPGGDAFGLVAELSKTMPATKIVMLSANDNPTYMARARAAGAANCLLKDVSPKELITAIENAAAGKPPPASARASRSVACGRRSQVLSHVAFGLSNDEIARSLQISVETVKEHVQNILRKLAAKDRTQAAVWAVQSGLV